MIEQNADELDPSLEEEVSKTRRKKEMLALQDLGKKLTQAPNNLLDKCKLPETLLHAINEYKRLPNKHGARKRQLQFIGKVMRNVDVEWIKSVMDEDGQQALMEKSRFQRLEKIREQLLSDDQSALNELIKQCPDLDIQHIRQLIRLAGKEAQENKPPVAYRKLFAYLRELPNL
jgi:ribosome-associated protein